MKLSSNSFYNTMLPRVTALFFVVFILLLQEARAQYTYGYEFKPKRNRVVIPFEWQNDLMIVKITINKSDTLNFILDSGAGMNMITDPVVAESLGLNYVRKINIVGHGEGEPLMAMIAINNQIDLPGVRAMGQSLVALSEDVLEISKNVEVPVHGIFGYDIFRGFVVEIDFKYQTITLFDPAKYKYKKRKGKKIPISVEKGKPYMIALASMPNGTEVPVKLILDTGSGHGLSLERIGNPDIILPEKTIYGKLGRGLNGPIYGHEGRLAGIRLGDFVLSNVISVFPDTNSTSARISKEMVRQGNLGCEVMKRFKITFNYNDHYVVLKRNRNMFRKPFERNMSGMEVKLSGDHLGKFLIHSVEKNSPAFDAKIMAGDEIISLNNHLFNDITMKELNSLLKEKEGKVIRLFLKRGNQIIYKEITLKKII